MNSRDLESKSTCMLFYFLVNCTRQLYQICWSELSVMANEKLSCCSLYRNVTSFQTDLCRVLASMRLKKGVESITQDKSQFCIGPTGCLCCERQTVRACCAHTTSRSANILWDSVGRPSIEHRMSWWVVMWVAFCDCFRFRNVNVSNVSAVWWLIWLVFSHFLNEIIL